MVVSRNQQALWHSSGMANSDWGLAVTLSRSLCPSEMVAGKF